MRYKENGVNNSAEVFARITAIINLIAIVCFFEATCCGIFEYLLAIGSKDEGLLSLISIYFNTVKING